MNDWRPFEPSRDEVRRIERERDGNTCNLHNDCAAADADVRSKGGRVTMAGRTDRAYHCHDEDCEDCFGC